MRVNHRLTALWLASLAVMLAFGCAKAKINTTRMVIGFGVGSSKLVARVQVYQAARWGLRRIAEATGSKTPGVAVPLAGATTRAKAGSCVESPRGAVKLTTAHPTRAGLCALSEFEVVVSL